MGQFGNNWGSYGGGQPGGGAPGGGAPGGGGPPGYGPPPQPQQQQPMGYGAPPYGGGYGVAPFQQAPLAAWICRWCGYQGFPIQRTKTSQGGIVVMCILIVVFLPLFWIGLLMKETVTSCPMCRR